MHNTDNTRRDIVQVQQKTSIIATFCLHNWFGDASKCTIIRENFFLGRGLHPFPTLATVEPLPAKCLVTGLARPGYRWDNENIGVQYGFTSGERLQRWALMLCCLDRCWSPSRHQWLIASHPTAQSVHSISTLLFSLDYLKVNPILPGVAGEGPYFTALYCQCQCQCQM